MELKRAELLKEWKGSRLRPAYLLAGEDASAKLEALRELKAAFKADDFNLREFSGEVASEIAAILSEALTMPVFSDRRLVIVKNPRVPAEARSALAEYLKDPLKSTTLVLLSDEKKLDPKDALVRAASACGAVCVFSHLGEEEARQRLQAEAMKAGKTLNEEAAAALVAEAGTDWSILSQELEKAALFSRSRTIGLEDVLECLGYQKSADPFALTRLIEGRRLKEGLAHLRRLLKGGRPEEQAFRALNQINASIYRQFRAKRMVGAGTPPEAIFRTLRLHSYWDRDYLAQLSKIPESRLKADLRRCLRAETGLKSQAWLDPRIELEHLVVDLCRTSQALAAG